MTAIAFTVPGPVRGKGRARIVKIGGFSRMKADDKTASYENLIALAARSAMGRLALFDGPVSVYIVARFAPAPSASRKARAEMLAGAILPTKKPDLDNTIKCLDALNGIVWRDDAQVTSIAATKLYAEQPGLSITVTQIDTALVARAA